METDIDLEQLIPVIFTVIFVILLSLVSTAAAKINRYSDSKKIQ